MFPFDPFMFYVNLFLGVLLHVGTPGGLQAPSPVVCHHQHHERCEGRR